MPTSPPSVEQKCPKCGGVLDSSVKNRHCITDMVGAALVGTPLLIIIGFLIFESSGPATRFIVLIAGFLVFGLYHMIGRKSEKIVRCLKCGDGHDVQ
jgi:hypothetical protein